MLFLYSQKEETCEVRLKFYNRSQIAEFINGRDLIPANLTPGSGFFNLKVFIKLYLPKRMHV